MAPNEQRHLSHVTAEIVAAYLSNNTVSREDLATLIADVHSALARAPSLGTTPAPAPQDPAVPIRRSVTPEYIFCLEDGKRFKSLRRHLQAEHATTPQEYRAKWGLKPDYPMVAPNYAKSRSELARSMGLGRKRPPEAAAGRRGAVPKRARRAKRREGRSA